jgi:hypothetical protein
MRMLLPPYLLLCYPPGMSPPSNENTQPKNNLKEDLDQLLRNPEQEDFKILGEHCRHFVF